MRPPVEMYLSYEDTSFRPLASSSAGPRSYTAAKDAADSSGIRPLGMTTLSGVSKIKNEEKRTPESQKLKARS
jgi:hypothetical protein